MRQRKKKTEREPSRVENALKTKVNVDGNRNGWSCAIANKSCHKEINTSNRITYYINGWFFFSLMGKEKKRECVNIAYSSVLARLELGNSYYFTALPKFHTSPIAAKVCCWSGLWLNKLSKKNCTDLLTYNRMLNNDRWRTKLNTIGAHLWIPNC